MSDLFSRESMSPEERAFYYGDSHPGLTAYMSPEERVRYVETCTKLEHSYNKETAEKISLFEWQIGALTAELSDAKREIAALVSLINAEFEHPREP